MDGFCVIMSQKHNYVECHHCNWRVEQQPDFDWAANPCTKCHNTRSIIDPKELLCNLCGGQMCHEIKKRSGLWSTKDPHGLYDISVTGGYESYHLLDLNRYTFSFCEECLRKLFVQCKIKPRVVGVTCDDSELEEYSWEQDQKSYEYRVWQDAGHHHDAYMNGRCNSAKDCSNKAVYTRYINDRFSEDCCCEEHKFKDGGSYKHVKFIPNVLKPFL